MRRLLIIVLSICSAALITSCSTTAETASNAKSTKQIKESNHPSWYSSKQVDDTESDFLVYGAAIGGDSSSVTDKAMDSAESTLRTFISDKLEEVRSEAVREQDGATKLNSSRFLIALRKADNAVPYLLEKQKEEVISVEGQQSYRGFVEASVPKDKLIDRIGKRLSGYDNAWNAMKDSEAFEDF